MNRTEISELTGFDNGELFENETQVRNYFQRELLADCIDSASNVRNEIPSQAELDDMAGEVLAKKWHCNF